MIVFEYPFLFWFLLLPFVVRYFFKSVKGMYGDALKIPFIKDFEEIKKQNQRYTVFQKDNINSLNQRFWSLFVLWFLLVCALAKPILIGEPVKVKNEGRDILMVTDISTSMLETDFYFQNRRLSRIDAVKAVVSDFVTKRLSDRMGLILFGTRAYLQVPLTFDKNNLNNILLQTDAGMAGNSTSIGDALGLALKTLKENSLPTDQKVIILLTDGENNDGSLSLPKAVELAREEGVKIYTIGVGSEGFNLANAFFGISNSGFDEKSLQEMANETKGRYFKATDLKELVEVYRQIDALEPVTGDENYVFEKKQLFYIPLLMAFLLSVYMIYLFRRIR